MTANAPLAAHVSLPSIDPHLATLRSDVIEALNRRRVGTLVLSAQKTSDNGVAAWIALEASGQGPFHLAPLLANGVIPVLTDAAGRPDAAAAAVALGALEPVVAAIELVVGRALRPTAVLAQAPADGVAIEVEARVDGARVHRLLLIVPQDARIDSPDALPLDPAAFVDVAPVWTARIEGPSVAQAGMARIGAGDLLLLGTGHLLARFSAPGKNTMLAARVDVAGGSMVVEQEFEAADDTTQRPSAGPRPGLAALSVPTLIEFDGGGLTLERLATLGVGSVVDVPAAAGGVLPVRLLAGGKAVASGELVAVGDGYGVLITAVVRAAANDPTEG